MELHHTSPFPLQHLHRRLAPLPAQRRPFRLPSQRRVCGHPTHTDAALPTGSRPQRRPISNARNTIPHPAPLPALRNTEKRHTWESGQQQRRLASIKEGKPSRETGQRLRVLTLGQPVVAESSGREFCSEETQLWDPVTARSWRAR